MNPYHLLPNCCQGLKWQIKNQQRVYQPNASNAILGIFSKKKYLHPTTEYT